MSTTKGNQFALIAISETYQVIGYDSNDNPTILSNTNFALDVSISEDGTLWVLSTTPDPDGGGSKLFWSNADGNWNEINTSDPGGYQIAGASGSSCYFNTMGQIWSMDTNGVGKIVDDRYTVYEMDSGGGYIWAVFAEKQGDIPRLHYAEIGTEIFNWIAFKMSQEDLAPQGISVDYDGNCAGVNSKSDPMYYSKDGSSTGSSGSGVNGNAYSVSFKNWQYVLSLDANTEGQLIYKWVDEAGGTYHATSLRALRIQATYNR